MGSPAPTRGQAGLFFYLPISITTNIATFTTRVNTAITSILLPSAEGRPTIRYWPTGAGSRLTGPKTRPFKNHPLMPAGYQTGRVGLKSNLPARI